MKYGVILGPERSRYILFDTPEARNDYVKTNNTLYYEYFDGEEYDPNALFDRWYVGISYWESDAPLIVAGRERVQNKKRKQMVDEGFMNGSWHTPSPLYDTNPFAVRTGSETSRGTVYGAGDSFTEAMTHVTKALQRGETSDGKRLRPEGMMAP